MAIEHESDTALAKAVRAAGSQSAFGRLIGRRQSTIRQWLMERKPLPAEDVLLVERETGIPKEVLRPDIYPDESDSPANRLDHAARDVGPLDDLAPAR